MDPMLIFLLTILKVISGTRYVSFNTLHGLRASNVYEKFSITRRSEIACSNICATDLKCKSVNFNNKNMSCELSAYHPDDLTSRVTEEDGWMLIYKKDGMKDKWTVVFRGTPKIGIDVADSFLGMNSLPTPDPGCYSWDNPVCNTHVRNSLIIDNWINLNITEVKVEFRTNGNTVAYVLFQNRNTDDKSSWFVPENILSSSWSDLPSETADYPYFQLERFTSNNLKRSFILYESLASSCSTATGWMFVAEVTGKIVCSYENYISNERPCFPYSEQSTSKIWNAGYGMAEVMLVSIKT